ncbi:acyl-[ACP]--phospholipid O-acyltransferase [Sphingomonas sp. H39-1-10]|uniref:acyl-[ACP]--phospholipid O-acyltransferase n=1 Tax=Sphingomonas pollutisoli TaxID=3030829 RepID=UPI0023B8FE97|nr:acyl-[ACP]--phospholipid O-acyltransferase [Sphingomonas pollutisoli]MDF0487617.1 acyl-[ACP]--phospholipid O-acyltransferase [Sphingomonas pollutisoli]
MSAPDFSLLAKRRFGPLFVVQFLGAFNDNVLKFAMLFLANFTLYAGQPAKAEMLATIATGIFILPYFLFSALGGQIADAWDKARLIRLVKTAEIVFMGIGLAGFWFQSVPLLLVALFMMGCHSTLFGPVKYSIMPQQLAPKEIMGATGVIEAGTFLAILGGQLLAGVVQPWQAGMIATALAACGLVASLAIAPAPPVRADVRIERNPFKSTWHVLKAAHDGEGVWLCILGISWFFAVGAILVSQFPSLVTGRLGGAAPVVTLFLLTFSIAVALGSLFVNRLLAGEVSARYVPVAALLMAGFMIDLWLSTSSYVVHAPNRGMLTFARSDGGWRVLLDLAGISFAGGMFIVPLYAILQTASPPEERSRIIAANNILNAAVTVAVVAAVAGLQASGTGAPGVIGALGFATLAVALISCWLLPETVIKAVMRWLLTMLYRVEVAGGENMPQPGERAVVVVNHVSWLDGLLLAVFLPGKPVFAVHTAVTKRWWMAPALKLFRAFPVDPTNPMSAKAMVRAVKAGNTLVIFPEGRITVTGALMKVFDGPAMVADKADAPIVPVRIEGAQFTPFSYLRGKVRTRLFPKISLTVLPPRRFHIDGEMTARARRAAAGRQLYDEMSAMIFATSHIDRTLFEALVDASHLSGAGKPVVEDMKRTPLSYGRLVTGSLALGGALEPGTKPGEAIGVLLPNVSAVVVTFFGLQATGRVPAMLNYTAGLANLKAACAAAELRTIVTARAFIDQAKLAAVIEGLTAEGITVRYLEDVSAGIGAFAKLRALVATRFAAHLHARRRIAPDAPAVILFTSGSEGLPKGVVLTHRNLLANCAQIAARIDFSGSDMVLNALPVFHSFGLTGGTLLPILSGVKTLLYPNPLHYRIVPALAYDANATILFGTDTFLAGYARMAHSYDFYAMRYVFAGAERVRDETRKSWMEKFGLRILEGYGATEAGPVIAVNTPMHFKTGSVGRLLPGIEGRLDPVPGIDGGGKLSIRGPNVMAGYLKADRPGVLQPPEGGWHDTGDIVEVDEAGFATIKGRAKRFAKIGGEMVSLPAVEGYAARLWPGAQHGVVTRPDAKKGEQLVLFTTHTDAKAADLQAWGRANGIAELAIPRDIRVVEELPVLGTGKTDYVTMGAMADAAA